MKSIEEKQRFVELRAKGLSFERIAEELKVSKPTLIKWSEELFHEVQEADRKSTRLNSSHTATSRMPSSA